MSAAGHRCLSPPCQRAVRHKKRERTARRRRRGTREQGGVRGWIRDVYAEGIHPHPGPRYVSKNVDGWAGKGKLYAGLRAIRQHCNATHHSDPLTAVFIQEHNLSRDRASDLHKLAQQQRLLAIAAYPPCSQNGVAYGGTAILIPYEAIEKKDVNESDTQARERVKNSRHVLAGDHSHGRAVSCSVRIEGQRRKLVAAYAPATLTRDYKRSDFFDELNSMLTARTILGIDANCVTDPAIDSKSGTRAGNEGAAEFEDCVAVHDLVDVAREHLGDAATFFTSHKVLADGVETYMRIDKILVPASANETWEHVAIDDFFPKKRNPKEGGHIPVAVRVKYASAASRKSEGRRSSTSTKTFLMTLRSTNRSTPPSNDSGAWPSPSPPHNATSGQRGTTSKSTYGASAFTRRRNASSSLASWFKPRRPSSASYAPRHEQERPMRQTSLEPRSWRKKSSSPHGSSARCTRPSSARRSAWARCMT